MKTTSVKSGVDSKASPKHDQHSECDYDHQCDRFLTAGEAAEARGEFNRARGVVGDVFKQANDQTSDEFSCSR